MSVCGRPTTELIVLYAAFAKLPSILSNSHISLLKHILFLVEEVQRMWRLLRDRFTKERRALKNIPSGSQAPEETIWPLYSHMKFLEKHIQTRKYEYSVCLS